MDPKYARRRAKKLATEKKYEPIAPVEDLSPPRERFAETKRTAQTVGAAARGLKASIKSRGKYLKDKIAAEAKRVEEFKKDPSQAQPDFSELMNQKKIEARKADAAAAAEK